MLVQTFIKVANYQHIMPTRYTLDVDLKSIVTQEALENSSKRTEARKVRFKCSMCAAQALCCSIACNSSAPGDLGCVYYTVLLAAAHLFMS